MAFKFVVFAACLAVAQAGVALSAVGASQQSTLRSLDGNSVVSTYAKQVDTPYSSVRKYDTRVTNDAVAYAAAPVAYAAPAVAHATYAAPAITSYAAPAITSYAAPARVAAPLAYAAPVARVAAPAVAAHPAALGVAYSAAPAVAHISYTGAYATYAY